MKVIGISILAFLGFFVFIGAVGFMAQGTDFVLYQFFAPKRANLERKVYENTHSYNQGMVQELQSMQFDYEKTTDEKAKAALAGIILHRAADFPDAEDKLPRDLYNFIQELKKQ